MRIQQRTTDSGDKPHVAYDTLCELRELAKADACVFLRVAEVDGQLHFTGVEVVGDALDGRLASHFDGRPATAESARIIRRPECIERFTEHRLAVQTAPDGDLARLDEARCLQLLIYDEDECIGSIMVLRWSPLATFSETTRRRLDKQVGAVREVLTCARREASLPPDAMYALCRRSGEITGGCRLANAWLDTRRAARLEAVVAGAAGSDGPYLVDGMLTQLSPIRAGDDLAMIVVRLEPAPVATMAPDAALTPTQREVAEFAVAGATANEIAEAMNRSVHTVRSHLKNIYERLQVASRLELAEVLRG